MPAGGKRKGAGRKPGNNGFEKEEARRVLREMVFARMKPLVEAQLDNAIGLKYLVARERKTGKFTRVEDIRGKIKAQSGEEIIEVWEKDPSVQAFTDLLNRTIDKPAETVNADLTHSGAIEIKWQS
jgi:hypothetical protein